MDKGKPAPKKLVRPTAANKPSTTAAATDSNKNGSASPSVAAITGEAIRKISMTAPISPINANRPGRLPSFRGERDLTLGGARPGAGADAGAKPKKVFAPTIPARRTKAQDTNTGNEAKPADSVTSGRGRGRRDGAPRGRGRGKPELIQMTGSVFGEGVAGGLKQRSSTAYADREDTGSSGGMEKPKLSALDTKIDKAQEDAALKELLRDDFIDGDNFDPDSLIEPIQLPKCSFLAKKEAQDDVKTEQPASVVTEDGVTIKQEKEEVKPKIYQRRINPSEVSAKDIFESDGELVFFQLPDVLPCLKPDKERPAVKLEPGTTSQKPDEAVSGTSATDKSQPDNVFEDTPEGRLGTLRIHQSGKVTLQMGNHSFVIDSSTQVPFLQDLISVDVDAQEKKGTMKDLGPIKYKAVLLPDWDDLIKDP